MRGGLLVSRLRRTLRWAVSHCASAASAVVVATACTVPTPVVSTTVPAVVTPAPSSVVVPRLSATRTLPHTGHVQPPIALFSIQRYHLVRIGWFEGSGVSTSRVSPPGPISLAHLRERGAPRCKGRVRAACVVGYGYVGFVGYGHFDTAPVQRGSVHLLHHLFRTHVRFPLRAPPPRPSQRALSEQEQLLGRHTPFPRVLRWTPRDSGCGSELEG